MTLRTLIRRNLRFHWRAHLGVVLGAAIGSAALIGALVVGDSVRESLKETARQRVGGVEFVVAPPDRLFRDELRFDLEIPFKRNVAAYLTTKSNNWYYSEPVITTGLRLFGTISRDDGEARANQAQVFSLGPGLDQFAFLPQLTNFGANHVIINHSLALQLLAKPGDTVLLRVRRPPALSPESAIATRSDASTTLRLQVHSIMDGATLGNFDLANNQRPPLNAFVRADTLQRLPDLANRCNLVLVGTFTRVRPPPRDSKLIAAIEDFRRILFPGKMGGRILRDRVDRVSVELAYPFLASALQNSWKLEDAELTMVALRDSHLELRSSRVFLDPPIVRSAMQSVTNTRPILTYLATLLRAGTNTTPYSMVTAAGAPWTSADLRDDEIVVSQWLADDLHVKPGDEIALSYFLPESGAKLEEATNTFRVHSIVPMEMPWADRTLMPDFPGIEKAESTRDWDAGFPLTYEIRKKDDDYWKQHRGTPKAFITLAAGQRMWANRFGNLTAIRFPIPTNATTALTPVLSPGERGNRSPLPSESKAGDKSVVAGESGDRQPRSPLPGGEGQGEGARQTNFIETYRAALEKKILANLKPEELGLRFEPVREQALKAAEESQDFGGLFLGFSFFLIAAALLLMAMLFQFGLEQRAPEIGTLLALGFTPKQVRKLLVREGVALAFIGGVAGAIGGIYFAKAMLHGLTTVWRDAVGATTLNFHVTGQTLVIGLSASVVVSAVTLWLALRKFVKREPRELLAGETGEAQSNVRSLKSRIVASASLAAALGLVGWAMANGDTANAGMFFGAGALVLVAGLGFVSAWLARMINVLPAVRRQNDPVVMQTAGQNEFDLPARRRQHVTLPSLALRGCARRRKRSLGTVAMLACGSFLIVSIGVFRLDANRDATERTSGTGGFALMGETTMPVVHDLNSQSGRDFFALSADDLKDVSFVPFRVREGDEASCLNLNAAQKPRLLGVKPGLLDGRFGFAMGDGWSDLKADGSWKIGDGAGGQPPNTNAPSSILHHESSSVEIPAIGDANSIQWAMKKKVGDTVDYVDERGQPFKVRIVGAVANSILQGQLIIDEAEFVKRFPGQSGYRMFLIDAPTNRVTEVSATLSRAMQDVGLELTPTATRLAQFNAVQNTYLGTFQVLGGLGLLLGSVGLGIVVLRNVLERRGELAVLLAVGFRKPQVQRLLLIENGALLAAGLGVGIIAAAVAVLPAVVSPGAQLPISSLGLTLSAILLNGMLWTWLATRFAVRGDLLRALRNE